MFWASLALMSNIIFEKMVWLKQGLLIAGGLYLCWLGYQMLRLAFSKNQQEEAQLLNYQKAPYLFFMKWIVRIYRTLKLWPFWCSVFSLFLANPQLDQVHYRFLLLGVIGNNFMVLLCDFYFSVTILEPLTVIFKNGLMVFLGEFLPFPVFSWLGPII